MLADIRSTLFWLAVVLALVLFVFRGCSRPFERFREQREERKEQRQEWWRDWRDGRDGIWERWRSRRE